MEKLKKKLSENSWGNALESLVVWLEWLHQNIYNDKEININKSAQDGMFVAKDRMQVNMPLLLLSILISSFFKNHYKILQRERYRYGNNRGLF
jgi:hypothetical protein